MDKLKIAVSACLLGHKVRYNKTNKHFPLLLTLEEFEYVPICPEISAGFGVPRESIQLEDHSSEIRLIRIADQIDVTAVFIRENQKILNQLQKTGICGFILKAKSPSCGILTTKVVNRPELGDGLFVSMVRKEFPSIPLISEIEIADESLRSQFIADCRRFSRAYLGQL